MGLSRKKQQQEKPARLIEFVSRHDPSKPETYGIYSAVENGKELVADVEAWKAAEGLPPGLLSENVLALIASKFPG